MNLQNRKITVIELVSCIHDARAASHANRTPVTRALVSEDYLSPNNCGKNCFCVVIEAALRYIIMPPLVQK